MNAQTHNLADWPRIRIRWPMDLGYLERPTASEFMYGCILRRRYLRAYSVRVALSASWAGYSFCFSKVTQSDGQGARAALPLPIASSVNDGHLHYLLPAFFQVDDLRGLHPGLVPKSPSRWDCPRFGRCPPVLGEFNTFPKIATRSKNVEFTAITEYGWSSSLERSSPTRLISGHLQSLPTHSASKYQVTSQ